MADYIETYDSGDVDSPEKGVGGAHTKIWKVMGEPSSAVAIAGVRAISPLAVVVGNDVLVRQNVSAKPFPINNWEVTVTYGGEDEPQSEVRPDPGFIKIKFSTGGGSETIRFAPMVARFWNTNLSPAPPTTAINFDGKETKGVESPTGNLTFTVTAYYNPVYVTPQKAAVWSDAVGMYNRAPFLGFPAGEMRYDGADGDCNILLTSGQRSQPIAIDHKFTHSFNESGSFIPGEGEEAALIIDGINTGQDANGNWLGGISKLGWQYLSVREIKTKDVSSGQSVAHPKHAYVHDPLYSIDFANFFGFG